jgi:hypothetical protein
MWLCLLQGNGGVGGADRRGVDDGNKRPASVKASLSVAMGQRAPNRAGAREERHSTANGVKTSAPAPRWGATEGQLKGREPFPARVGTLCLLCSVGHRVSHEA